MNARYIYTPYDFYILVPYVATLAVLFHRSFK